MGYSANRATTRRAESSGLVSLSGPHPDRVWFLFFYRGIMKSYQHLNDHSHITSAEHAKLFKTGIIDVNLLGKLGLQVPDAIKQCPIVAIEFVRMAWNKPEGRDDPVFAVKDAGGTFCGQYFASAFTSLVL